MLVTAKQINAGVNLCLQKYPLRFQQGSTTLHYLNLMVKEQTDYRIDELADGEQFNGSRYHRM